MNKNVVFYFYKNLSNSPRNHSNFIRQFYNQFNDTKLQNTEYGRIIKNQMNCRINLL